MSRSEFDQWLYEHAEHFRTYQAWEVARVAILCGFEMRDIAPDVSGWIAVSRNKLDLFNNPLMEQWVAVTAYQRGRGWDTK